MEHRGSIAWLLERIRQSGTADAIVWHDAIWSYADLLRLVTNADRVLDRHGIRAGRVVSLEADYSPRAVSMLLALLDRAAVLVPLTSNVGAEREEFLEIAGATDRVAVDAEDGCRVLARDQTGAQPSPHPLTRRLMDLGHPGLVLFSSGSTGKSKAALHDMTALLEKFKVKRHSLRTLTFLLLDHIGGLNTLFYALSNHGTVVSVERRDPDTVCAAVERYRVELLPTSPTFLNLLLLSEAHQRHDLSSLKRITYGTEVMPRSTLERLHQVLPGVELLQTYGLSEVGILRSKSRDSGSLWVKVGGEDFETKVIDGILWVRARSAMLGYLNHPSPFDADGWLDTGDLVELDGEWLRFLGRRSDVINVGGQKVYPAEVESVLLDLPGVQDVTVIGEHNPITGQVVAARFNLDRPEPLGDFKRRMRAHCRARLAPFKVPVKVQFVADQQYSARYKRIRRTL
jgi:long-chain acyl-CoA synthetase